MIDLSVAGVGSPNDLPHIEFLALAAIEGDDPFSQLGSKVLNALLGGNGVTAFF